MSGQPSKGSVLISVQKPGRAYRVGGHGKRLIVQIDLDPLGGKTMTTSETVGGSYAERRNSGGQLKSSTRLTIIINCMNFFRF